MILRFDQKEYDNFYYTYPDISGHWFSAKPAEKMRGSRISGFIQDYHGEKDKVLSITEVKD